MDSFNYFKKDKTYVKILGWNSPDTVTIDKIACTDDPKEGKTITRVKERFVHISTIMSEYCNASPSEFNEAAKMYDELFVRLFTNYCKGL